MLSLLASALEVVVDLMQIPFVICGVELTFWGIGLCVLCGTIIIGLIVRFLL